MGGAVPVSWRRWMTRHWWRMGCRYVFVFVARGDAVRAADEKRRAEAIALD
jgi:hypothetical protein